MIDPKDVQDYVECMERTNQEPICWLCFMRREGSGLVEIPAVQLAREWLRMRETLERMANSGDEWFVGAISMRDKARAALKQEASANG